VTYDPEVVGVEEIRGAIVAALANAN
jgi:hypothetical protein